MQPMDKMIRQGEFLFRWRSYLPLLILAVASVEIIHFQYPWHSHRLDLLWEACIVSMGLFGFGIRCAAIGYSKPGTSGRNTKRQKAHHLNRDGMYSICRHPLYLGNVIIYFSIALFFRQIHLSLFVLAVVMIYYDRIIMAEEKFLRESFGDEFSRWSVQTPAFIPNPALWIAPERSFDWKKVLRREYTSLFAIVITFTALELITDLFLHHAFGFDAEWMIFSGSALLFYLTVRYLKRHTRILESAYAAVNGDASFAQPEPVIADNNLRDVIEKFDGAAKASEYAGKRNRKDDARYQFEAHSIIDACSRLKKCEDILDAPCGTGRFVPLISELGNYYGLDSSRQMVDICREQGVGGDHLQCSDISQMPFPDKTFDCVIVIRLFHHIGRSQDRAAILKELSRVSQEGVLIYFYDKWTLTNFRYWFRGLLGLEKRKQRAVSRGRLKVELEEAGFFVEKYYHRKRFFSRSAFVFGKKQR